MRFIPSFPLLACMALWLLSPVPSPADKPNIVLILADDMGWSDLGCYGSEIPTPHLDSLAAQGMLATRCYTASRCSPSRASIMTGCEPHKVDVGLLDDDSGRPGYRGRLNPDIPTLPELLKKRDTVPTFPEMASGESPGNLPLGPRLRPFPRPAGRRGGLLQAHAGPPLRRRRKIAPAGGPAGEFLHDGRHHPNGPGLH